MMRTQITILVTGILLLFCPQIYSQYAQLQGKVIDEEEKPLIGVNVYLQGTILGSATDSEGEFMIEKIPSGDFKMTVSMIGYQQKDFPISIEKPKLYDAGTIQLTPSALSGEPIVVTAGKYEQKVQDVAASLSTLSQKDLQYRNSITVKDALQFVSGVN
ncbi:MAG: hypothetical protein GWN62_22060, partial [Aliifodinibius sp.]|nr:hypothetical protein [Fodinibius sp.]